MSGKEKAIAKSLADAVNALPDNKKEYLIGFAEGVAAMAEKQKEKNETATRGQRAKKRGV